MTAYEKDLDDTLFENYVCMVCGWWIQPNIIDECGCEEEWSLNVENANWYLMLLLGKMLKNCRIKNVADMVNIES